MPTFEYTAVDVRGGVRSGSVVAGTADAAANSLRAEGLFPTGLSDVTSAKIVAAPIRPPLSIFRRGLTPREVALFTRQLATLLQAGMPLVRGLEVLGRQERRPVVRTVIEVLRARLSEGRSLSEAMSGQSGIFDQLYLSMVRAGEAAGALAPVLDRLARFAEKSLHLRARVRTALIYPGVVLAVAGSVLAGLVVFVVPRFQQIFSDLLKGAPLPPLTQAVLDVSALVRAHGLAMLGALAAAWFAVVILRRSTRGAHAWGALVLHLPLVGAFCAKAIIARWSRTLGTLLASGVPVLPALAISRESCGNARFATAFAEVHDRVKAGEPLARPLEQSGLVPPLVTGLVDVGEHTGQLPAMLGRVADIYEDEVDQAAAGLGAALEPMLILFLAIVVGGIVIALFLPIVRIVQLLA